jgi:hypothetical protein
MPVVLDYAPISVNASRFDQHDNSGGNDSSTGHAGSVWAPAPGGDDHGQAVEQLHQVVANYSYLSTVNDPATITDQSVSQNIWADGDVEQWFDNDSAAFDVPAIGAESDMSFANTRIDDLFDVDVDTDAHVEPAGHTPSPSITIKDAFDEDTSTYFDSELNFAQEDPAINDVDDADAEETEDHLEFDS